MKTLSLIDAFLIGLFSFAAIHYAIQWWLSRHERVLGVFAIQCAVYAVFTVSMLSRHGATTIPDAQAAMDRTLTLGLTTWIVVVQFFAVLGQRRDHLFRALVVGVLVFLVLLNHWVPLRGTVVELRPMELPTGGTALLFVRTGQGAPLAVLYLAVLVVEAYAGFITYTIWKRGDRAGALLIAFALISITMGSVLAVLVDFAGLRAPYIGASAHAIFVICMAVFLAREYAARASRAAVADRHFATIFERAPIGMALLALGGQILRVNRALCNMFGIGADELCTRCLQDLTDDDVSGARLRVGEQFAVETRLLRGDGKRVWALLAVSAVPDDEGRPARIIAQLQDITELREHRDELEDVVATRTRELNDTKDVAERANAAKSQFLAHISHEIRTPLGVIMLYAQLLQRYSTLDDQQRNKVDIILSSGKHLLTLLSDVLEMSKIEAGHASLVEDRFDPWATLDEIETMFAVQCAEQGLTLTIERAPDLPRSLLGDGGKVKQILINLVGNAVKFTKQGSIRIKASTRALADEILVEIIVADTGIGISAPDVQRMFQPFEQLKPSASTGGTGLGLAISLNHARLMGGDLTVESAPDVGSTFTFTFAAKALGPAVRPSRLPSPPVTGPTQCKVLIVDDLKDNRDILQELLTQPSYETRTAADGPGALAIHADWFPDLVLIDLRMPDMDGLEAIRRMRAAGSKAAIGVLTASAMANDEREALAIGADFFMRKPYEESDLFKQIARALARKPERPPTEP